VEENGDKIESEFVTLRVQTSTGRSSSSWGVRVYVTAPLIVLLVGGWKAFVADNRLQTGDHLIFVLREDARSEFEVHFFRGPKASPYFPDEGERPSDEDEEDEEDDGSCDSGFEEENTHNQSRLAAAPEHEQQDEHHQAFISRDDIREGNPAPLQHAGHPYVPRFSKRLVAFNIGIYLPTGKFKPGQFVSFIDLCSRATSISKL